MPMSIMWIVTAAAVAGTVLNVQKRRACFVVWFVTNVFFVAHNALIREWPQAVLFSVYAGIMVWGWTSWRDELED